MPTLYQLIDQVSTQLQEESDERIGDVVVDRLAAHPGVEAAGIWLDGGDTGAGDPLSWQSTPRADHVRQAAGEAIRARLGTPGTRDVSVEELQARDADGQLQRLILTAIPFSGHGGQAGPAEQARGAGVLGLLTRARLDEPALTALRLLSRQLGAEIGWREARAGGSRSAGADFTGLIALVTHELRTPLTGLRGNIQLAGMAARKGDLAKTATRLQTALRGVDILTALVQNLQDINHLERGQFKLAVMPGDLAATVAAAVASIEHTVDLSQHQIEVLGPESVPCVHDAGRMQHAFYNLLLNAVCYSPDGGVVRVEIERDDELARVSVSDPGIGIPAEERPHIFTPYYRGALARECNAKGLGVGLAIGLATVEQHGGRIEVTSEERRGSRFTVVLPCAQPGRTGLALPDVDHADQVEPAQRRR